MLNSALLIGLRRIIVLAVMLGVVSFGSHNAVLHHPGVLQALEDARHASLADDADAHGHVHDDGFDDEREPGHMHGHNTSDHSHAAMSPVVLPTIACVAGKTWESRSCHLARGDPSFPLDRPPRPAVQA